MSPLLRDQLLLNPRGVRALRLLIEWHRAKKIKIHRRTGVLLIEPTRHAVLRLAQVTPGICFMTRGQETTTCGYLRLTSKRH